MIDYCAHALALENVRDDLAGTSFGDPDLEAARDKTLTDLANCEGYALLGGFVDHLLAHASSDGTELVLLEKAADVWADGVALYGVLGSVRTELEAAIEAPGDPTAAGRFNAAAMEAQRLAQRLHGLQAQIVLLREEIDPLLHLPAHPRQVDKPANSWDWGNFLLARRTDAFVRALAARSSDSATRAFAFGALASYTANVSAAPYFGHVVGGPRRSHRYRNRIARNTIGSWLRRHHPTIPSLTEMADRVGFGDPAVAQLPQTLKALIADAVSDTFEPSLAPSLPDLGVGYRRLVRHLGLLDRFTMPPAPAMPSPHFTAKLFADPTAPSPTLRPQTVGVTGDTSGGVGVGSNTPGSGDVGKDDSKKTSGGVCAAIVALIILFVILLVVAFIKCVIEWADGNQCNYFDELGDLIKDLFEEDPPHPTDPPTTEDPDMTAQGLAAFAATDQAVQLVGHLWDLQQQMWEGLDQAYGFLAKTGLIYPDRLIDNPGFKQFTSIPGVGEDGWPHRPEADPENSYHLYPQSPVEQPTEKPSPFASGASPNAFAAEPPAGPSFTAAHLAVPLWRQIALGESDSTNFDEDADRGHNHPCWATAGSINDDPVDVVVLGYEDA